MDEMRLDMLLRVLGRLDHYARTVSRDALEHDFDTWLMVSRAMELAAQACIDLALAMIVRRGLSLPDTYRAAFARLAETGSADHARVLEGWAGLRNILAHVYAHVDLDRPHAALTSDIEPLRKFGRISARELV